MLSVDSILFIMGAPNTNGDPQLKRMAWKLKELVYIYILSFEFVFRTSHTIKCDTKSKPGWSKCSQYYTQTYKKHPAYTKSQMLFTLILLWPARNLRARRRSLRVAEPPHVMGGASTLFLVDHFVGAVGGIYTYPTLPQWSSSTSFTPIQPVALLSLLYWCSLPLLSKALWSSEVIVS